MSTVLATYDTRRTATSRTQTVGAFGRALDTLTRWQSTRRERAHLASLDDRLLMDIGITRADVERECRKPFWSIY